MELRKRSDSEKYSGQGCREKRPHQRYWKRREEFCVCGFAICHMREDKNCLMGLQEKEADFEKQCKNMKWRGKV